MDMRRVLLVGVLMAMCGSAGAATYYVATTGSDAAAGSEAAPWKTINTSVGKMADGDTLMVQAGTYTETLGLYKIGVHAVPITIQAVTRRTVILEGTGAQRDCFWTNLGADVLNKGCNVVGLVIQNWTPHSAFCVCLARSHSPAKSLSRSRGSNCRYSPRQAQRL